MLEPYYQDRCITILNADVREGLASLPDNSVHCVCTSPPYWGLRDYGIPGQLGLESTIQEYITNMVAIFDEVRRVLREDGTCWVNIGDSYAGSWGNYGGQNRGNGKQREIYTGSQVPNPAYDQLEDWRPPTSNPQPGLKPKDLCLIPERLAISLQDAGWWIRSRICWAKKSPRPESVRDRPTSAWEHIWLLTKSSRYFYDAEAVRAPLTEGTIDRVKYGGGSGLSYGTNGERYARVDKVTANPAGRNQRNFWLLGPEPFPQAHFATFPTEIPRRAILAGTSERGCCSECQAPWERVVEKTEQVANHKGSRFDIGKTGINGNGRTQPGSRYESTTTGWRSTCTHDAPTVPCTVLDPFLGAGTTLLVASRLNRKGIGIELNPAYCQMSVDRITADAPLFHVSPHP